MRKLEKWYVVQLTHTTVIGKLYGDKEWYNGSEIQVRFIDLDVKNRILKSSIGNIKLGDPDEVWWKYVKTNRRDY